MPCKGIKRKFINSTNVNKALLDSSCCSDSPEAGIRTPSPKCTNAYLYI